MIKNLFTKLFGSRNQRLLKQISKTIEQINALENEIQALDDNALAQKTVVFRQRYTNGESLDDLLPEAFAVVREAGKRALNMRHFDVQLIGGVVLHQGKIAEMRTGEGKTLVATLAAYLNALSGKGVHVITVNDYLAKRDAAWMGKLYEFLGMSVGVVVADISPEERKAAYAADITYGTNNEFGFDYLRDNMAFQASERVQRELNFTIIDEVDSILIDEARTPLIISGQAEDSSELYRQVNTLIPHLTRQERMAEKDEEELPGDYAVDEKAKQVYLSDEGHQHIEEMLIEKGLLAEGSSLYDNNNIILMHHVTAALRAHVLFQRNTDYIVNAKQEVVIVDEFTGRTMEGRRWSEGLHQAVEAKEGVPINSESQTLASITFQNYFRLYNKLSGMTGTADTEAFEFQQIYGLEVVVMPTNKDMIRDDKGDLIYLTEDEKYEAILADIRDCQQRGQPVLVGTVSIENSEKLSAMLKRENIAHRVLNAKFHEQEADIVAQAGRPSKVTIATNMAGRGTDIVLGGNVEVEISNMPDADAATIQQLRDEAEQRQQAVLKSGGLHIIGTERHESRRIDNQLRGRAGRQGDAGSTRFYLSLEDSLMRIFASERMAGLMKKLGMEKGEAIEHPWVTKAIENAQRKVEGRNFDIRKQLLEYDDVANDQRKVVYEQRRELMEENSVEDNIDNIREDILNQTISRFIQPQSPDEMWDIQGLETALKEEFYHELPIQQWLDEDHDLHEETLREKIVATFKDEYKAKEAQLTAAAMRDFEKAVMLQLLDKHWKEHLAAMDYLRQGIHLRGFAQKNPKQEYKREAFEMFSQMIDMFKYAVLNTILKEMVNLKQQQIQQELEAIQAQQRQSLDLQFEHAPAGILDNPPEAEANAAPENQEAAQPFVREGRKIGRNEPCPCGSGKKYKQCHGKL